MATKRPTNRRSPPVVPEDIREAVKEAAAMLAAAAPKTNLHQGNAEQQGEDEWPYFVRCTCGYVTELDRHVLIYGCNGCGNMYDVFFMASGTSPAQLQLVETDSDGRLTLRRVENESLR